ncbi:hypothetical protein ACG7TL_005514 [Trametes sanguinea]
MSASDLLLSDLHLPTASVSPGTHVRGDKPPPPKRRKVSPRPVAHSHPSLQAQSNLAHTDIVDAPSSPIAVSTHLRTSPPPVLADMPFLPPPVKRERSPTPSLSESSTQVPRLILEGCVRIAPTPLECKSVRPGYQAARQRWTASEVKKLRERGLRPTRVLIREDGMVIDWTSKVPVLSDTLRPPPSTPSATVTGPLVAPDTKLLERNSNQSTSVSARVTADNNPHEPAAPLPDAVTSKPYIPRIKPRTARPPGQTIWERVSPPSRRPPAPTSASIPVAASISATNDTRTLGREPVPSPSLPTDSAKPAAVAQPPTAHSGSTRSNVPPDVEVIDLTGDSNDATDFDRSSSSSPEPLAQVVARRSRALPTPDDTPAARLGGPDTILTIQEQAPGSFRSPAPVQHRFEAPGTAVVDVDPTNEVVIEEKQAAAIDFLQRYLMTFMMDRSDLASAYSHTATFSVQILPLPSGRTDPRSVGTSYPSSSHHQGRLDVIAALLDLPEDRAACDPDAAGEPQRKVDWDLCYAREAGDTLLVCSFLTAMPLWESEDDDARPSSRSEGKGKGKERAVGDSEPLRRVPRVGVCEQRFVLRPREWDEEDRSTPGVWPLVAVAHQMLFRPLPPH